MNKVYIILAISILLNITCFVIAGILCYNGIEGWGWFVFAGMIVGYSYKSDDNKKN